MTRIADSSIDLICSDLPYGVSQNPWDSVIPLEPLWTQYKRIIKPKGAIVLTATQPFTARLAASNLDWLKYEWIWCKSCPTGYLNAHKMPMQSHETILVFGKKTLTYNPQNLEPFFKMARRGRATTNYGDHGSEVFQEYTNYPRSLLHFPYDQNKMHPTQKPVALFEYLIRTYTNAGETVLDNCMGSGTTGVACLNSERNFIGFELDTNYFKMAEDRIQNHIPPTVEAASIDHLFV